MIPTTPDEINPAITAFCRRITPEAQPVYVDVDPMPEASAENCFSNVVKKVATAGGWRLIGWAIWTTPYMLEGEFHAVWRSPSDELVDVSPRPHGEKRVLFLPDPSRPYEGRQVNNIREPIHRNDVLVERFIKVSDQIFEVMNRGERADQHGRIRLPTAEIAPLLLKKKRLGLEILRRRIGPNEPCLCGSAKKLKNCCRRSVA